MKIQLLAPHTHAGRDYPAGAILTLADAKAEWLIAIGKAEEAPAKPDPLNPVKETA